MTGCRYFTQSDSKVQVSVNTKRKKCVVYLPILDDLSLLDRNARKIELIDGVDFYLVGDYSDTGEDNCYFWIYFLGSPLEAKNYAYTISIEGQDRTKIFSYGNVIPLDVCYGDIVDKKAVFTIRSEAVRSLGNEDSKLPVEVTIHALKEEAKDDDMESGVSTDESDN